MHILLNGERMVLEHPVLKDSLLAWGYTLDMPMAVAVNCKVIPNSAYAQLELTADDEIEILMPMQGG